MRFIFILIVCILSSSIFAQSDTVSVLNRKIDQIQYQFYQLQWKVDELNQDLKAYKNLSSDSIKLLMQSNEELNSRVSKSESQTIAQSESMLSLQKIQEWQNKRFGALIWISFIFMALIIGLLVYLYVNNRKKMLSQRALLEKLFNDSLRKLDEELKTLIVNNREKTIVLENALRNISEQNKNSLIAMEQGVNSLAEKTNAELHQIKETVLTSEKEMMQSLATLKANISKTEKKFEMTDKEIQSFSKKNEKLLKEKVEKIKEASRKNNESLFKKIEEELAKNKEKTKDLQKEIKEIKKVSKDKKVTFRVKKSS